MDTAKTSRFIANFREWEAAQLQWILSEAQRAYANIGPGHGHDEGVQRKAINLELGREKVHHFVVVRERRGSFYQVIMDPVAFGSRWLTAAELAEGASARGTSKMPRQHLHAESRLSRVSRARNTSPMPPAPMSDRIL